MSAHIHYSTAELENDLRYLRLLSRSFPTVAAASTEIINLEAILNLPKGTEHFLTDIHGEYEAFQHVLKNASGTVKRKVNEIFGNSLRESEKKDLCTLIYYPQEKLELVKAQEANMSEWYEITLNRLVKVCQSVSSKYTRSKVNKALPKDFSYIIQELLHETEADPNKHAYFNQIISTIISTRRADAFIIAMCNLIQRLAIDSLHIVGDIADTPQRPAAVVRAARETGLFGIRGRPECLTPELIEECCQSGLITVSTETSDIDTIERLISLGVTCIETSRPDRAYSFLPAHSAASREAGFTAPPDDTELWNQ